MELQNLKLEFQARQQEFMNEFMEKAQVLSAQMARLARNQNPYPPPPPPVIESGRHPSGMWCTNCGHAGHIAPVCNAMPFLDHQRYQNPRRESNFQGPSHMPYNHDRQRNNVHNICGKRHPPSRLECGKCGFFHPTEECTMLDRMVPLQPLAGNYVQQAYDNQIGVRGPPYDNTPRLPNLYDDQSFHKQNQQGLQTNLDFYPLNPSAGIEQGPRYHPTYGQSSQDMRHIGHPSGEAPRDQGLTSIASFFPPLHPLEANLIPDTEASLKAQQPSVFPAVAVTTRSQAMLDPPIATEVETTMEDSPKLSELQEVTNQATEGSRNEGKEPLVVDPMIGDMPFQGEDKETIVEPQDEKWEGPKVPDSELSPLPQVKGIGHQNMANMVHDIEMESVSLIHVEGTQNVKIGELVEEEELGPPGRVQEMTIDLQVGADVATYPPTPVDWHRGPTQLGHVNAKDWKLMNMAIEVKPPPTTKVDVQTIEEEMQLKEEAEHEQWLIDHPSCSTDEAIAVNFIEGFAKWQDDDLEVDLATLVDDIIHEGLFELNIDSTLVHDLEEFLEESDLVSPLHFKTMPISITASSEVAIHPQIPTNEYQGPIEQAPVPHRDLMDESREHKEPRVSEVGVQWTEKEEPKDRALVMEFSDVFAWSYKDLKRNPPEVAQYHISLIPRAIPIRQTKRRMNLKLQWMVKAARERLHEESDYSIGYKPGKKRKEFGQGPMPIILSPTGFIKLIEKPPD